MASYVDNSFRQAVMKNPAERSPQVEKVSRILIGISEERGNVSDALFYSGTSLTYALISFYTIKNAFDHVMSPNTLCSEK
ncbi:hypothetical protein WISP_116231 [Willisornis vidua]|uniref:Uncharacterized protein n=1 Tax=Willisornis vidua TaxID=1566151 RepID=A0ABQ9CU03_9PASS|nr:hypothetical protein WISP_116231 [Willisornis vidua]